MGPGARPVDAAAVGERLAAVRRQIERAGGDPATIRVVAVTKGFGPDALHAARSAGLEDVGENYAQELLAKSAAYSADDPTSAVAAYSADGATDAAPTEASLATGASGGRFPLRWHFLGALQRRKVRQLAPVVSSWDALARVEEGVEIARRQPGATVLVQVDATGRPERNGCPPAAVSDLVTALSALDLRVAGLMTVAPPGPEARSCFRTVRQLADALGLAERSMGMSGDLELAVAEGATTLRLGRTLFGDRPARGRGGGAPRV